MINMSSRILNNEEIYLRLIEEEYTNQLSRKNYSVDRFKDNFKSKVMQIILEEKRQNINFEIEFITSSESNIGNTYGL